MKSLFSFPAQIGKAFLGSRATRYLARYELLASLAKRWELRLYNLNVTWYRDAEFISALKNLRGGRAYRQTLQRVLPRPKCGSSRG